MDGGKEIGRWQYQNHSHLHEQDDELRGATESPNCSHEVSQDRHPAHDRHQSATQLQGCSHAGHDGHQLGHRPEEHCDEDKAELYCEWTEIILRIEVGRIPHGILNYGICILF